MLIIKMNSIQSILTALIIVLAVPTGYMLAYLCRDELVLGRKWFRYLLILSFVLLAGFFFFGFYEISLTFLFIFIVVIVSYIKSRDKKLANKRI